ncbi:MAG: TetR/AcrR family transcriptional regulator [Clostridia bacterium]|nr:TetR/AcrR family transcriptional regulator [Clostridia bacterium]
MANACDKLIYDEMSEQIIEATEKLTLSENAHNINVRKILKYLGITNRVFYNRFHNIDEVLAIISERSVLRVREGLKFHFDEKRDFFEQILEEVEKTLIISYETRMNFAHYVFENDSVTDRNYKWWVDEIKKILDYAIDKGHIKKVDTDMTSYAIWCFIRGFNADAIGRKLPLDEAIKRYRYGFKFILDGLKK